MRSGQSNGESLGRRSRDSETGAAVRIQQSQLMPFLSITCNNQLFTNTRIPQRVNNRMTEQRMLDPGDILYKRPNRSGITLV